MTTPIKIPFKPYSPKQAMLLPFSFYEMVSANHLTRIVDRIDQIDIHPLIFSLGSYFYFTNSPASVLVDWRIVKVVVTGLQFEVWKILMEQELNLNNGLFKLLLTNSFYVLKKYRKGGDY